ncbi:MAG: Rpn family recombination-promoting nuclease/putative transposase, partial [Chitinophagales bacterium]
MEQTPTPKEPTIDYDGRWKTIIEQLFDDFMAFFMPDLFKEIDFSKKVIFLDKELQKIMPQKERKGKRISDCLAKVHLKNGKEKWILVHIEVQSSYKANFSARMFKYFYRIFDKYEQEIAAIAIFTNEKHPKNYNIYNTEFFGTQIIYKYNTYKISEQSVESLQKHKNPFALAVLANKYVLASKNKKRQRLQFKIELFKLMHQHNFSFEKTQDVFNFIQYLMLLPEELELEFNHTILETYKQEQEMKDTVAEPAILSLMKQCVEYYYGDTFENLLEKERQKAEQKVVLERQKAEQKVVLERQKAE